MKRSLYQCQVERDVREYIENEIDLSEYKGLRTELEEQLHDDLWIDDSVTGNGTGIYTGTFAKETKETVFADTETVREAIREFCVDAETIAEKFLEQDWDYFDVTARCYVLGSVIYEIMEELEEKGVFEEEEEEEEEGIIPGVIGAIENTLEGIGSVVTGGQDLETVNA